MKRTIGTYFSQYFRMPHLFRDDLDAIEKVIREDLRPKKYGIACHGLEYAGLKAVPPDLAETHVLVIYTHSPCMRLKFTRSWTELYGGDDGAGMGDAVRKIAHIVSLGERRWLWNFCSSSSWLAPLIGFGSFALVVAWVAMGLLAMRSMYLVMLLILAASIWWGVGYHYKLRSFSLVDLRKQRGPQSWLSRHRRAGVIFLAGIALGGIASGLLAGFFRSY